MRKPGPARRGGVRIGRPTVALPPHPRAFARTLAVMFYVVPPGLPFPLVFPVGYNEIQVLSPVAQTITYS